MLMLGTGMGCLECMWQEAHNNLKIRAEDELQAISHFASERKVNSHITSEL